MVSKPKAETSQASATTDARTVERAGESFGESLKDESARLRDQYAQALQDYVQAVQTGLKEAWESAASARFLELQSAVVSGDYQAAYNAQARYLTALQEGQAIANRAQEEASKKLAEASQGVMDLGDAELKRVFEAYVKELRAIWDKVESSPEALASLGASMWTGAAIGQYLKMRETVAGSDVSSGG